MIEATSSNNSGVNQNANTPAKVIPAIKISTPLTTNANLSLNHPPLQEKGKIEIPQLFPAQTSVAPMQFEPRHFINLDLNGMVLTVMVDSGAAQSYLGKGISTILKGKFSPLSTMVTVADGTPVASQGILTATFSIDGMEKTMPLNISDELQYEGLLGIDFLRLFNIRINYENNTWWTEKR